MNITHEFSVRRRRALMALCGLGAATAWPVHAKTAFPSRVVRIVPFGSAGSPIDTIARIYAEKLQPRWSQAFIVDAKPGASGIIAADSVAKSPADAAKLLAVGEAKPRAGLDPAEVAAFTLVAGTLLNLDETLTRN